MAKQTRKHAVEQRTQQRLAARKDATQRGVETRRRNRESREQANAATHEAEPQAQQPEMGKRQTKRLEANTVRKSEARPGGQASAAMATVALRGESAQRFRALAEKEGLTLAKLLVRMMEVFEAQAG